MYYKIYTDIRDAAWQCLIDNNIDRLPVDVLKIARQSNIDVKKNSRIKILAHELGHILLGHVKTYAKYATIEDIGIKPKAEKQADTFALRLLCPACILMELDLHTPEEISTFCRVPTHWAQKRSDRMKELYKRNKFFTNNLEIEIHKNFNIYLSSIKENQRKDPTWHSNKNE